MVGPGDEKIKETDSRGWEGLHKLHFMPNKFIKKCSILCILFRGEMEQGQWKDTI